MNNINKIQLSNYVWKMLVTSSISCGVISAILEMKKDSSGESSDEHATKIIEEMESFSEYVADFIRKRLKRLWIAFFVGCCGVFLVPLGVSLHLLKIRK